MNFNDLKENLSKLKNLLSIKKEAIVKNDIEALTKTDEDIVVIFEEIKKVDLKEATKSLTDSEKAQIRQLSQEIKKLENDNEILIKHSLDVINGLLSGILNIAQNETHSHSYDSKGKNCVDEDTYRISSITEEA